MKRDLDLLRAILLKCEDDEHVWFPYEETHVRGGYDRASTVKWTAKEFYHIQLLNDAGYISFNELRDGSWRGTDEGDRSSFTIFRLTDAGYDDPEAVRDQSIWEQTKEGIVEGGGNATLDIVKALAIGFVRNKIKDYTGVWP